MLTKIIVKLEKKTYKNLFRWYGWRTKLNWKVYYHCNQWLVKRGLPTMIAI